MYTTGLIDSCFKFQITMQWAKDFELQYVLIVSPCRNAPQAKILGIWTLSNEFTYGFDPFRFSFLPFASPFLPFSFFLSFFSTFPPNQISPIPTKNFPNFPKISPKSRRNVGSRKKKLYGVCLLWAWSERTHGVCRTRLRAGICATFRIPW